MKKILLVLVFLFLMSSQCLASQMSGKYNLDEVNGKTFEICKGNVALVQAYGKGNEVEFYLGERLGKRDLTKKESLFLPPYSQLPTT